MNMQDNKTATALALYKSGTLSRKQAQDSSTLTSEEFNSIADKYI
jgi:hypothetical protein